MASWKWPAVLNKMLEDIPGINTLLNALLKQDPAGTTDVPVGAKRWTDAADGKQLQVWNGSSWSSVGKLDHDAASVDGHSASTGTTANTIPVRDKNGALPGDILGNAATASEAAALSEVNPIEMGGTGGSTAAKARENLVVPPKNHASSSTDYGLGTSSQYGHTQPHDEPDATLTAAAGHAFSPAGAANLKTDLDAGLAKKLDTAGGTMTGPVLFVSGGALAGAAVDLSTVLFSKHGDYAKPCIVLWGGDDAEKVLIRAQNKNAANDFLLYPDGTATLGGHSVLTSAGGTMTGFVVLSNDAVIRRQGNASDLALWGGDYGKSARISLFGQDSNYPGELYLYAEKEGAPGGMLILFPDGRATINGSLILTSAGGPLAGALTTSVLIPLASDSSERGIVIFGGKDWEDGYLHLTGKNSTDKNCYIVTPVVNGKKTVFAVDPGGNAFVNNFPIFTSANGLLLNSSNVQVFSCPVGGGWTAPSGGSWAYLICGEYNAQNIYGAVAGGTYVAWPNGGHPAQGIAFRIGN